MASNPFRTNPGDTWAKNFRRNVDKVDRFGDDAALQKYKTNIVEAFGETDEEIEDVSDTPAVQNFSDVQNDYTVDAVKRLTVLAAIAYQESDDYDGSTTISDEVNTYDDADPGDVDDENGNFYKATEILGSKFVSNWAAAYQ